MVLLKSNLLCRQEVDVSQSQKCLSGGVLEDKKAIFLFFLSIETINC